MRHERTVRPGDVIQVHELKTVSGASVMVPGQTRLVHLQFRRFAGCPVCSLHLRSFVRRSADLAAAGVSEVVVFHSPREELLRHAGDLPFAVIADPDKVLYAAFGVEPGRRALLDPRAWPGVLRAVIHSAGEIIGKGRPAPPLVPHGGRFGLPAELLIAPDGRVLAVKYGRHADDQWTVDELLAHVVAPPSPSGDSSPAETVARESQLAASVPLAQRGLRHAMAVFALTSLHHAYGAYAYNTPWRLHVIPVVVASSLVMFGLLAVAARSASARVARAAMLGFAIVSLVCPVVLFGLYEGGFNHGLKNLLHFSGASRHTLDRLYDPSLYVLPDDLFFETTGVLQVGPALTAGMLLVRLVTRLFPRGANDGSAGPVKHSAGFRPRGSP